MKIELRGHHKLISFLQQLPKRLDKAMVNGNEEFLKKVKKSAKLMAPRDTGALANSITMQPTLTKGRTKQFKLLVDAPYAYFQEEGFTPHVIHSDMVYKSRKLTGKGFFFVQKHTPFMKPAFDANKGVLMPLLMKKVRSVIK
jgi:hypothetical protein